MYSKCNFTYSLLCRCCDSSETVPHVIIRISETFKKMNSYLKMFLIYETSLVHWWKQTTTLKSVQPASWCRENKSVPPMQCAICLKNDVTQMWVPWWSTSFSPQSFKRGSDMPAPKMKQHLALYVCRHEAVSKLLVISVFLWKKKWLLVICS